MTEKSRSMIRGNGNQPLASCSPLGDRPAHYYLSNLPVDTDTLAAMKSLCEEVALSSCIDGGDLCALGTESSYCKLYRTEER